MLPEIEIDFRGKSPVEAVLEGLILRFQPIYSKGKAKSSYPERTAFEISLGRHK